MTGAVSPLLEVQQLSVCYSGLRVLWDVSLVVNRGEIVTLLGANGAGKSTLVQSIFGLTKERQGRVIFDGAEITRLPTYQIITRGLSLVPEKRELFPKMTVEENLELGGYAREEERLDLERIYAFFPILRERKGQQAGTLSGGEQQMLAISRALMNKPSLIVLDEPSLGLSPLIVTSVLDAVKRLNQEGLSILLVEQNVQHALEMSHRGYVIETGRIVREGPSSELLSDDQVQAAYLGT